MAKGDNSFNLGFGLFSGDKWYVSGSNYIYIHTSWNLEWELKQMLSTTVVPACSYIKICSQRNLWCQLFQITDTINQMNSASFGFRSLKKDLTQDHCKYFYYLYYQWTAQGLFIHGKFSPKLDISDGWVPYFRILESIRMVFYVAGFPFFVWTKIAWKMAFQSYASTQTYAKVDRHSGTQKGWSELFFCHSLRWISKRWKRSPFLWDQHIFIRKTAETWHHDNKYLANTFWRYYFCMVVVSKYMFFFHPSKLGKIFTHLD